MRTKLPADQIAFILLCTWLCLKILTMFVTSLLQPLRWLLHILFILLVIAWALVLLTAPPKKQTKKKAEPVRKDS
jgi:hypothetical protein